MIDLLLLLVALALPIIGIRWLIARHERRERLRRRLEQIG